MFKKNKRNYHVRISDNGIVKYSSTCDTGATSDQILSKIEWLYKREGKLVIEFINDETVHITSLDSIKDDKIESKMEEIKQVIKQSLI